MIYLYYLGAALLIWLSIRSLISGFRYLRFFELSTANRPKSSDQFASVFLPCRGLDKDLEQTISALLEQDHRRYELLVIVGSEDDVAVPRIRQYLSLSTNAHLIVSSKATTSSQKIHNLLAGIEHASGESSVFLFVDSDAQPRKDWLKSLVGSLTDPDVGAASGYRWYLPETPSFASELRAAWNASIASALGQNIKGNFCWGGSMAVNRDLFDKLGIAGRWRTGVSDDFILTKAVKDAGLGVVHVPQALCVSSDNCSFAEFLEFATRQMKITRVYSSGLWVVSLIGSGIFSLVMIASIAILIISSANEQRIAALFSLVIIAVLSIAKAWIRMRAIRFALPEHQARLRRQTPAQLLLTLFTPVIFFINCVSALLSRTIEWRGIRYQLKSPHETVIISD